MKKVRRSLATVLLLFVMTTAAFADGQIGTPPGPIPGKGQIGTPPVPTMGGGQIDAPSAVIDHQNATTDILAEFALDIWNFLPSFF